MVHQWIKMAVLAWCFGGVAHAAHAAHAAQPNFVVIFCDDLGYGDLGCYGSEKNRTPAIDQLAKQGMRFTDFYSSSPVCTPSRASLMTGCYARRVGLHEDATGHWVLIPRSRRGLAAAEQTMPELLRDAGYATCCIGKWHLGDQPQHLPAAHGFDQYYGIPYSNDMQNRRRGDPPLPLVRGGTVLEAPADQSTLTKRYTEEAIRFIQRHKSQPFLLYLPHTFPHLPLHASKDFLGQSKNGRYGDAVEEIDWSTAEILECLEELGLAENTLVVFTSDNGSNGRNGGSNAPLAGAKGSTMEGGMRVPMIVRWPGETPAGAVCSELATTMDLLPTFCHLAGAARPQQPIDGHDIAPLLRGEEVQSPYKVFYYYRRRQLQAIRWGVWKWHLPLKRVFPRWNTLTAVKQPRPAKLVNLREDLQERNDVSERHPEVVQRMRQFAMHARAELGDEDQRGDGQRTASTLDAGAPMLLGK